MRKPAFRARGLRSSLVAAVGATALFAATSAQATQRYASPSGAGAACTSSSPCDIVEAMNMALSPSDEVIVNPGIYSITQGLFANFGGSVHGATGQPRPLILTSATNGLNGSGSIVSDLRIEHTGTGIGLITGGAAGVGERLEVISSGSVACDIGSDGVLRDSFCVNNKTTVGDKLAMRTAVGGGTATGYARNVTAIATEPGSYGVEALAGSAGGNATIDLRNVIASGVQADIFAQAVAGGTATATATYSNYDHTATSVSGTTSVTMFGTGTNQIATPLFADEASGDYHEASGSPTIDAGAADARTGATDVDGEARAQGSSMDIGADEFTVAPPEDTTPPQTTIVKHPKKKSKSRKAKFTFSSSEPGSTFACKLDEKSFKPCTSPTKLTRLKKGKHTFSVVATDVAGNADATPATYKWKVRKRRHH